MATDSGNHAVNVEDVVLSGKVNFKNQDFVLLLQPDSLVFREFATENKGFTITMDQILTIFHSSRTSKDFTFEAIIPRSQNDPTRVQASFQVKCATAEEAEEWVETVRSVITDKQLRSIKQEEEESVARENRKFENLMELKGMFPDIDDEIIRTVYNSNNGNMDTTVNSLLSISDPSFASQNENERQIEEQMRLDEQLAIMLQDELFIQQIQNDQEIRRDLSKDNDEKDEISVISSKIQEMSLATKKKFMEYYNKFKKDDKDGSLGEELQPLKDRTSYDYDEDREEEETKLERSSSKQATSVEQSPRPAAHVSSPSKPSTQPQKNLIDLDDDGL